MTLCKCCTLQNFPIPADELIAKAKKLEAAFGGALDDSLLAPDFRFEFPVVSLAREVRTTYTVDADNLATGVICSVKGPADLASVCMFAGRCQAQSCS